MRAVVPVVKAMVVAPNIAAATCTATAATATASSVLGFMAAAVVMLGWASAPGILYILLILEELTG